MRVLVCGSRHFQDHNKLVYELSAIPITHLITGGAKGADSHAEFFAKRVCIPHTIFPANWDKYGKGAGPIRNKQMLDEGKPDLVIAFLAPNSRGTKNMIEQAKKAGVPVQVIEIESCN